MKNTLHAANTTLLQLFLLLFSFLHSRAGVLFSSWFTFISTFSTGSTEYELIVCTWLIRISSRQSKMTVTLMMIMAMAAAPLSSSFGCYTDGNTDQASDRAVKI